MSCAGWVKWEYLKYNIRKYTINFSKQLAKTTNKKTLTQKQNSSISENIMRTVTKIIKSLGNNQMQYTKKKQKVSKLEVNVTGMSLVKNPFNFF